MIPIRSPSLFSLSAWSFLCLLGWFVVQIIIHAEPGHILPLAEQTNQLFMYSSMLLLAALSACWYSDFVRTKASRSMAFMVTTFTTFAWIWNLWFVIPAFSNKNSAYNVYCSAAYQPNSPFIGAGSDANWCALNRAAAAFDVGMLAGLFMTWLWALIMHMVSMRPDIPIPTEATILAPHGSNISAEESGAHSGDVNWRSELTEPDDLEVLKVAANNPYTHQPLITRMAMLSIFITTLTYLSLAGWIVLTVSLIDIARAVGLNGWDTTEQNVNRLGDPIVQSNWYWLTLSLGITLTASAYSAHRYNRGVIGGALLLTSLSMLQWISLFIYAARRLKQQGPATDGTYVISDLGNKTWSQYAEVAGMGLITLCEFVRTFVLVIRYMTYMVVTKLDHDRVHIPSHVDAPTVIMTERDNYNAARYDGGNTVVDNTARDGGHAGTVVTTDAAGVPHQHVQHQTGPLQEMNVPGPAYDTHDADVYVPSYNMGMFHGASIGFKILYILQTITIFGWFILELIFQCNNGLFSSYQGPNDDPYGIAGSNNDRSYYYSEYMFLLSTVLVLGAWLPAFYAERELSVASAVSSMYTSALMCLGFFLLIWPYAYEGIYSNGTLFQEVNNADQMWTRSLQTGSCFAMISAFWLLCLWVHSVIRVAERQSVITTWERSINNIPSAIAPLFICAIGIWAFCTLYYGLFTEGVFAQWWSVNGHAGNYGNGGVTGDDVQSYFATQAFLIFAACSFAVWVGCYASKLMYAWQNWSWRMAALFTAILPAAFLVPMIIQACYYIHNYSLANGEYALCAAIIILTAAAFFYLSSFSFLVHEAFYSAGPTGAALPPTGMQLKGNEQFVTTQTQKGVMVGGATEMTGIAVQQPGQYQQTTTYATTSEPAVNPRTGDVGRINHNTVAQETVVEPTQPVVVQQPVAYETVTGTTYAPQPTVMSSGAQEIRYHDY